MSVKDVIKNSFLKQMGTYDMGSLAISLLAAVLLGVFIYLVYKTFYSGSSTAAASRSRSSVCVY